MPKMIKESFLILLTAALLSLFAWLFAPPAEPVPPPAPSLIQEIDQETLKVIAAVDPHLVLDARPEESYQDGHIPGAVSLPAYEFETHYPRVRTLLNPDMTVIVYCSSSSCQDADLLAQQLAAQGVDNLLIFRAGYAEWKETGNPVATGDRP